MSNKNLSVMKTMSSLEIAKLVDSRHDNVKISIERLARSGVIWLPAMTETKNYQGVKVKSYNITKRDSYVVVAQLSPQFTGRLVDRWIELENKETERLKFVQSRSESKLDFRPMTDAIQESHDDPKFYHYTNECDMINRIVFGCSSQKFKVENGIEKNDSLRDFLSLEQINAIVALQKANTALINIGMEFDERKDKLTILFDRKHKHKVIEEYFLIAA